MTPAELAAAIAALDPTLEGVEVRGLARISSVGNARAPWRFEAVLRRAGGTVERVACVLLAKADAGQLETALGPEFRTIAALGGSGVPAPRALWLDETGQHLGRPFFVTEHVAGTADTAPLRRAEPGGPLGEVGRQLARAAARLHAFDWRAAGCGWLAAVEPADAAAAQVRYWKELFLRHRLEANPGLVYAFGWLEAHDPAPDQVSIVHGDLRFGNLLYDGDRLTALLDWEMVHLGDPVEDLGWVYRSVWTPERALPFAEFLAAYEDEAGAAVDRERLRWHQVLGEVKHAVISLTAARSFHDRRTLNLRMADRAATVPAFLTRVWELIP
ncbi:MAG: phosphotransferase family protein [Acidimicrobiales bacterium]